jgi:hypothetical protein
MRRVLLVGAALLLWAASGHAVAPGQVAGDPKPQYSGDKLVRPDGYREWIYLSSGLGMNYNASAMGPELFTNVFVAP